MNMLFDSRRLLSQIRVDLRLKCGGILSARQKQVTTARERLRGGSGLRIERRDQRFQVFLYHIGTLEIEMRRVRLDEDRVLAIAIAQSLRRLLSEQQVAHERAMSLSVLEDTAEASHVGRRVAIPRDERRVTALLERPHNLARQTAQR